MALWDGIEEFAMVAQTGSFTTAARRLKVSTSHISRRVQALEDRLETKLLARTTRTVRLTELGAEYYAQIEHVIAGLQEANQSIAGNIEAVSGLIRVSAAGPFAEQVVAPRLLDFAAENPRITLEIDFNNRNVDLVADGYDFALRYGVLSSSSLIARKLVNHRLACVAAPAYLARHGTPQTPQDLRQHSCLVANNDTWLFHNPKDGSPLPVKISGRLRTNNIPLMQDAVRRGFGIAYSPIGNLQPLIDAGEATPILEGYEDQSRSHWIVYADRRLMPRHVRAAIDHLLASFATDRS
ncbi:LysR family transcriptional regulator [Shimia sp. MMG029]|uniref:LysR family transcriptional regulator n=1 Tax=Shimia sp. MMG029 TaxID=3021978 RepID=UPI0022FDF187|nr:LysR family transcriptional regulator [Shimia sp. MMG029]MDA5557342.1 LysR family transcriptional regulator [Shimia sp. MMG029]